MTAEPTPQPRPVTVEYGVPSEGATLVFLPALGVPLAFYDPLLTHWADRGRRIVAVEMRGMPSSTPRDLRRAPFGYRHLVRHDLPAVLELVGSEGPVVVVGHSLGGQVALLAAASGAISPDGVVTLAAGTSSVPRDSAPGRRSPGRRSPRRRSPRRRVQRGLQIAIVRATAAVLGYWPGHRLGFAGRQPRALMRDWAFEARHGRYRLHGDDTDYETALAFLRPPALLVAVEGDPLVPAGAVAHLAARLPPTAESISVRAGSTDHFLWARRQPGLVVDAVEDWLTDLGLSRSSGGSTRPE
ncbi:Predicted alpha/beta hydrolase [Rathayibacter oskolensis]|uniref:Predicted alpha/beta hydrolase n=1 Tax=Rathayibacter oskolensis TaxID=1891671 RepID=A0A1X7MTP8_9MICO|nr:alpha/beta fold hydrolase [Rathayibacter oskolensis]SMH28183.1 Predicted alpha/beta hydrolase [Rathayibacter oskolensis]